MRVAVEGGSIYDLRREGERVVVQKDGPEDGSLRLEVVRKRAFADRNDVGHV